MNIITKLIVAGVIACSISLASSAQAGYHGHGHYYGGRHYWHGRSVYAPGYYGPDVFVGSPWFYSGYGGGPYYGGYGGYGGYYGRGYRGHYHGGYRGGHGGYRGGHGGRHR